MRALVAVAIVAATFRVAQAIVGGAPSDRPAVVALVRPTSTELACSGTVIAPHAVLTAAHCVREPVEAIILGQRVAPIAAVVAPGFDATTLANDLAVLVFDTPLAPAPLAIATPAPAVGVAMDLVGFGRTAPDDTQPFAQRSGTATVAQAASATGIVSHGPAFTCEGDSGGPALVGGAIVGVTSSGDAACAEHSRHVLVADHVAFVADVVAQTGPGAARAGDRCWYAANCAVGACLSALDEPRLAFCAPACTSGACPDGLACIEGACRHAAPSPGAFGAACASDGDCVDGLCAAPADDTGATCTERCFTDLPGFTCPAGSACLPARDGMEACFASPPDAGCCSTTRTPPHALALLALLVLGQLLRGRGRP